MRGTGVLTATVVFAGLMLLAGCGAKDKASGGSASEPSTAVTSQAAPAVAGKPQTECPVMGGKIVKTVFADHNGKRVYFCCKGCDTKFKQDPEKYIKKLEAAGIALEKAPPGSSTR